MDKYIYMRFVQDHNMKVFVFQWLTVRIYYKPLDKTETFVIYDATPDEDVKVLVFNSLNQLDAYLDYIYPWVRKKLSLDTLSLSDLKY